MNTAFRPAKRSQAKPMVGIYAESGDGKTWSALLLARGFVGPAGKIGMIETEGGRGEANVGREPVGQYLVRPITGDFSPMEYGKAIDDAEKAGLDALIIDSASHEWEGAGGVLSMAAKNDADGKKGVLVWQQPKILHQRHFMLRLMQTPIPLVIVCMRAKYPMEQKGSNWTRSNILEPKQSADILFEMFVHGWIDKEHRFNVTKETVPEMLKVFANGQPISIGTGERLAAWAKGGTETETPQRSVPTGAAASAGSSSSIPTEDDGSAIISAADYCAKWRTIIDSATSATSATQLGKAWNDDKAARDAIEWPDDGSFVEIKTAVTRAVEFLKKSA